jgi:hypothetical protein
MSMRKHTMKPRDGRVGLLSSDDRFQVEAKVVAITDEEGVAHELLNLKWWWRNPDGPPHWYATHEFKDPETGATIVHARSATEKDAWALANKLLVAGGYLPAK